MYLLIYVCLFDLELFDAAKDPVESINIGKLQYISMECFSYNMQRIKRTLDGDDGILFRNCATLLVSMLTIAVMFGVQLHNNFFLTL